MADRPEATALTYRPEWHDLQKSASLAQQNQETNRTKKLETVSLGASASLANLADGRIGALVKAQVDRLTIESVALGAATLYQLWAKLIAQYDLNADDTRTCTGLLEEIATAPVAVAVMYELYKASAPISLRLWLSAAARTHLPPTLVACASRVLNFLADGMAAIQLSLVAGAVIAATIQAFVTAGQESSRALEEGAGAELSDTMDTLVGESSWGAAVGTIKSLGSDTVLDTSTLASAALFGQLSKLVPQSDAAIGKFLEKAVRTDLDSAFVAHMDVVPASLFDTCTGTVKGALPNYDWTWASREQLFRVYPTGPWAPSSSVDGYWFSKTYSPLALETVVLKGSPNLAENDSRRATDKDLRKAVDKLQMSAFRKCAADGGGKLVKLVNAYGDLSFGQLPAFGAVKRGIDNLQAIYDNYVSRMVDAGRTRGNIAAVATSAVVAVGGFLYKLLQWKAGYRMRRQLYFAAILASPDGVAVSIPARDGQSKTESLKGVVPAFSQAWNECVAHRVFLSKAGIVRYGKSTAHRGDEPAARTTETGDTLQEMTTAALRKKKMDLVKDSRVATIMSGFQALLSMPEESRMTRITEILSDTDQLRTDEPWFWMRLFLYDCLAAADGVEAAAGPDFPRYGTGIVSHLFETVKMCRTPIDAKSCQNPDCTANDTVRGKTFLVVNVVGVWLLADERVYENAGNEMLWREFKDARGMVRLCAQCTADPGRVSATPGSDAMEEAQRRISWVANVVDVAEVGTNIAGRAVREGRDLTGGSDAMAVAARGIRQAGGGGRVVAAAAEVEGEGEGEEGGDY